MRHTFFFLLIFLGLGFHSAYAESAVQEYQLKNGLKVLVKEDHRAPVSVFQIWYKVGSGNESDGTTGISHVLEHMMFKGTKKHSVGEFSKKISKVGGQENAMTSADYTAYYETLPAKEISLSFELEADRMHNLLFNEKEFAKEMEVIKEERRMRIEDQPDALTYERFKAAAHLASPYRFATIGFMTDLNAMTVDDIHRWYKTWYVPNNAVVVVVGDVKAEKIYQLAKKYFGDIPAGKLPIRKILREPEALSRRYVEVKTPAKTPILIMGFNTPSLLTVKTQWHPYALEVISGLLAGGKSARLPKNIVRGSEIASAVEVDYDLYTRHDGLFTLDGVPTSKHTIKELQQALLEQITKLQTDFVEPKELQRVKTQVVASKTYSRDSLFGQALILGSLASADQSWQEEENYVKQIQSITPEQIRQVAQLYLIPTRMTIAELIPVAMQAKKE